METPGLSGFPLFSRSICPLEVAMHSLPLPIPLPQYHNETIALLLLKVSWPSCELDSLACYSQRSHTLKDPIFPLALHYVLSRVLTHSLAFKHPKTLLLNQLLFLVLWLNNEGKRLQEGKFHLWLMVWGVTAHHGIEDAVAGGSRKWRTHSSFAFFLPLFFFQPGTLAHGMMPPRIRSWFSLLH